MKLIISLLLAIAVSRPILAQPVSAAPNEQQVRQVLLDAFQALSEVDLTKFRAQCKADFTLLENGEIWTLDTLEARMKPRIGRGMKRINTLVFHRVDIKGDFAWVTYNNQADFDLNGQKRTAKWLESAVLEKQQGAWKLAMLHSTVLPAKK